MNLRETASQARLHELLAYEAISGVLTWRVNRGGKAKAGTRAGCPDDRGYRLISVDGLQYWEHRLIWCYVHGEWPKQEIDHRDRDKSNNSLSNLRLATRSEQNFNKSKSAKNTSGVTGVHFDKSRGKWMAFIKGGRRMKNLGRFDDLESAVAVRRAAELRLCGEFAQQVDV